MLDPLSLGLIAAALAGAGLVVRSQRAESPSPVANLRKGQFYRVSAHVPVSYVNKIADAAPVGTGQKTAENQIALEVGRMGFSPVEVAIQDVSDAAVWTILARWNSGSGSLQDGPNVHVFKAEPVEDPPVASPRANLPTLDNGLTLDEVKAVKFALANDSDPARLNGFSSTFDGDYPITSALLQNKSRLETLSRTRNKVSGRDRVAGRARVIIGDVWSDVTAPIVDVATSAIDDIKKAASDLGDGVSDMWDKFGGVVEAMGGWVPGPQIWLAETAIKEAQAIAKSQNAIDVLKGQTLKFAQGVKQLSPILALVPGVGTGIAVMLDAAADIAICVSSNQCPSFNVSDLTGGLADAVGSVAGPVGQEAFKTAANFGYAMARGERADYAALDAAREELPNDEAKAAFDTGLALARGKALADVGFAALAQFAKGNSLAEKAADFAESVVDAKAKGEELKQFLTDKLVGSLAGYSVMDRVNFIGQGITALTSNPALMKMFPSELADKLNIPEDLARAALAAVVDLGNGIVKVDPDVSKRVIPDPGLLAAKSALQLQFSLYRPAMSRVTNVSAIESHVAAMTAGFAAQEASAIAAKASMDRAKRILDRQKWVTWYRAIEAAGMMPS